jgi:hypothetical protein
VVYNDDKFHNFIRVYPYKKGVDFEEFNNYLIEKLKGITQ